MAFDHHLARNHRQLVDDLVLDPGQDDAVLADDGVCGAFRMEHIAYWCIGGGAAGIDSLPDLSAVGCDLGGLIRLGLTGEHCVENLQLLEQPAYLFG
ncbi:hypothetical protein SDC9_190396 [bioreactor metagenome]|uniref:Uncharacterized protein n=1 Tax=bioreactor metagenome TaxID=1076179 RepID=A0A645HUY8_9ZZZZ